MTLACAARPPVATLPAPPPGLAAAADTAPLTDVSAVFYTLVIEGRELAADVFLNDVLVESVDPADRATLSTGVNSWIQPGDNRLEIRSRDIYGRAGAQHALRVRLGRRHADPPAGNEVLADLNVITADPTVTFAESRTFRADPAPPAELWRKARPLTLDERTCAAGAALARELERAFHRRDVDAAAALLEWKTVDVARAAFREAELARAAQRESLESLFQDEGFVVDHFTPEAVRCELRAGGRLLHVARPTGPVLQARLSQGGRFRLPVLAANIGGTWRIVR